MVFYGTAPEDDATLKKIEAPVYGFYGGNDARITGQVPQRRGEDEEARQEV